MILRITILSLCLVLGVQSQENAATSISKSLIECYNKTENLERERRPSSTINVLLELIRKVESGPSIQNDREFAIELIHRFKQDGIIRTGKTANSKYSVPYTPKGFQSDKNRLSLRKFIPGNAVNFPNETLTELQRCTLHFMLSNSVDAWQRGDENQVCNRLGRFQSRMRRDVNPNDQVESFQPSHSSPLKGNLQEGEIERHEEETESEDQVDVVDTRGISRKTITINLSECPVENGAVYSRWGTIQIGTVIAAIAAGRNPQENIESKDGYSVDNRHSVTLAGDLAEVALHQGVNGKATVSLGAPGGWNGTQVPRWYFINKNVDWEMTDAELRGGLDGLIIAKNIKSWKERFSSLKLSQVLDMYYSPRGVFSSKKYRACNRNQLFTEVAPEDDLLKQTIGVGLLLDDEAKLQGTISVDGIKAYGEKAVKALLEYVPRMQDLSCIVEDETLERASTDIIIVLDTQWEYNLIQGAIGYLLDNVDVNQYGSNYTLISAKTGDVLINSTKSIVDLFTNYDRTTHLYNTPGFDASKAFDSIEKLAKQRMDADKDKKRAGGQSTIALFVLNNALNPSDKSIASSRKESFRTNLPDMKLLVLGRNSKDSYSDLVTDPNYDVFELSDTSTDGTSVTQSVKPLIARIKEIPIKLINPNCGSIWSGSASSETLDQYVEPKGINYYRVASQYLFGENTKNIKIQGYGFGNLVACTSRQNARPSQNFTEGDVRCEPITGNNVVTFSLSNPCGGYDVATACSPLFISVKSTDTIEESTNPRCTDSACRFPDNIKYSIKVEGLGCESGCLGLVSNIVLLISMLFAQQFLF